MPKRLTFREYKMKTGRVKPKTDRHGYYLDKTNRFFLGKFTHNGRDLHPAAVVGEGNRHVFYVLVTHTHGGRNGSYKNPDLEKRGKVGLNHQIQSNSDKNIHYIPKYAKYDITPINSGLDRLIEKAKKGNKK